MVVQTSRTKYQYLIFSGEHLSEAEICILLSKEDIQEIIYKEIEALLWNYEG